MSAPVNEIKLSGFAETGEALRNPNLMQAMYDEGAVIMEKVLLTLHGDEHRKRRMLEFRVFRRDFFRYYENDVFPATLNETIAPYLASGTADLIDLGYRVTMNLTADFAGVDCCVTPVLSLALLISSRIAARLLPP